ncbi:MAG: carbohydrate kinase [Chitinophagaceae bacterium]|nr:carbohydrate kinase [Chitinophagaceae bacterium]
MEAISVIAIFDIGKTNKKLLLFDEQYKLVWERAGSFAEQIDEDGFPCEDIEALTAWIYSSVENLLADSRFYIKAINFSAYGASFVYIGKEGKTIPPLYNYLKPYPTELGKKFYLDYGGEQKISKETASPILGNLNSGMQLYRIKYQLPQKYQNVETALHLPQFLSYLLTRNKYSEYTSIGCHTQLWDFNKEAYHDWVSREGIDAKLAPIRQCDSLGGYLNQSIPVGVGIHDSSAALIPYLISFKESFILLSTGTWCISLNPFNQIELTEDELKQDCLCYISFKGNPVKASRLFAGYEHEEAIKKIALQFNKPIDYYTTVAYDASLLANKAIETYESAYHRLMAKIIQQQVISTNLVLAGTNVRKIFVDGGFSKNPIYMQLLADSFFGIELYAASMPQASALGAALSIHQHWNERNIATDIMELEYYVASMA